MVRQLLDGKRPKRGHKQEPQPRWFKLAADVDLDELIHAFPADVALLPAAEAKVGERAPWAGGEWGGRVRMQRITAFQAPA